MSNARVSVVVTAYNHKDTIMRAIDSVLAQNIDSCFWVIVVDDGSTDGTAELLKARFPTLNGYHFKRGDNGKFKQKYSVEIHLQHHMGLMKTFAFAFGKCKKDYIAVCDGDDYWTDENKLQRQYDYMERFPSRGFCSTRVWQERTNGSTKHRTDIGNTGEVINESLTFDNLLRGNSYLNAQSYFIRKSIFDKWIDFEKFIRLGFYVWDYPIVLELINRTSFQHLDFISAVFTIHDSYTHTTSRKKRLKMVVGQWWIRTYYIFRFGCKPSTFVYSWYRLARDVYSVIFKRWYK